MTNLLKVFIALFIMSLSNIALASDITTTTATTTTAHTVTGAAGESSTTSATTTNTDTTDHDQQIVIALSDMFANSSVLTGTSLTATCQNSIVIISGTVTTQSQADQAVRLAQSIPGVTSVNSQITVTTNPRSP